MAQIPPFIFPIPDENTPIPSSFVIYVLIGVGILISYGIIGSHYLMGLNLINSIYFTITTISTVGFGDIVPITPLQKIFVISLIIFGVGLLAYAFILVITVTMGRSNIWR